MASNAFPISRIALVARANSGTISEPAKVAAEVLAELRAQTTDTFTRVDVGQLQEVRQKVAAQPHRGDTLKLIDLLLGSTASAQACTKADDSPAPTGGKALDRSRILEIISSACSQGQAAAEAQAAKPPVLYDCRQLVKTDRLVLHPQNPGRYEGDFAFGGTQVALRCSGGAVAFFDSKTGAIVGDELPMSRLEVSGHYAFAYDWEPYAGQVFNIKTGALAPLPPSSEGRSPEVSPQTDRLLIGCENGEVQLYDLARGELVGESFACGGGERFSPDGRFLLVGTAVDDSGSKAELTIANTRNGEAINRFTFTSFDPDCGGMDVGFVCKPDGSGVWFANGSSLRCAGFDRASDQELAHFKAKVAGFWFSSATGRLIVHTRDKRLFSVDPTRQTVTELGSGRFELGSVRLGDSGTTYNPEAKTIAVGDEDDTHFVFFDPERAEPLSTVDRQGYLNAVSRDGRRALFFTYGEGSRIYDTHTGKPVGALIDLGSGFKDSAGQPAARSYCELSPDGRWAVAYHDARDEQTPHCFDIFDTEDGSLVASHLQGIKPKFSPEGSMILAQGPDCMYLHHFAPK